MKLQEIYERLYGYTVRCVGAGSGLSLCVGFGPEYLEKHDGQYPLVETKLGRWVNTQRKLHKQGRFRSDRKAQLDSIGFQMEHV